MQEEQCSHIIFFLIESSAVFLYISIISRYPKTSPSAVQCSAVQSRGKSAFQYIAVQCKSAICYTVKFNAVHRNELQCIETTYIFKTVQRSSLHKKEVQCNSMEKNVDQCSAVECTAAQPCLTRSPKEKLKSL